MDTGLDAELSLNLSKPLSNVTFRVCAYTGAGQGPWTPLSTLTLVDPGETHPTVLNIPKDKRPIRPWLVITCTILGESTMLYQAPSENDFFWPAFFWNNLMLDSASPIKDSRP